MPRLAVAILAVCLITGLAPQIARAQSDFHKPRQDRRFAAKDCSRATLIFAMVVRLASPAIASQDFHFPGGGTLGPDLTRAYRKLGPRGTQSAMQTLYFQVMTPIYSVHPLGSEEQADLMAFLEQAESQTAIAVEYPDCSACRAAPGCRFCRAHGISLARPRQISTSGPGSKSHRPRSAL